MARKCQEKSCTKQPSYNKEGETTGLYCATHKKEGMINVKDKTCKDPGCKTRPNYNDKGKITGLYCASHKKEGMVNVVSPTCAEPNCKIMPVYNVEGEKKGIYCKTHKKDCMIDVKNKICVEPNCKKRSTYNKEGETKGLYCTTHKKDGMIDVKHKTCAESGCKTIPMYNKKEQTKGLYCATHKKDEMVDVKNKTCVEPNCKTIPTYNIEGKKQALYCSIHKKDGMINVKDKTCKSSWCNTLISNSKYEGYCLNCFIHLFPDEPNTKNYKTKEKATTDYVLEQFPKDKYTWITDKKIQDGCSRKRPDLYLDLGYQVIILEIDENQHQDYDCSCENKRLMLLSQDVGHRPLVFIRFNPDDYLLKDSKVTSCWSLNGQRICTVKKTKQKEWNERLESLKTQVEYWLENKTNKTVEVIQLFYDSN